MKINFDELFSKTMPLSTLPLTFTQEQPNIKANHHRPSYNQQNSPKQISSYMKKVEHMAESRLQNSYSILQKLNKLTKMIEDKKEPSKKKSKVNITQLTNKLYQPAPTSKKNCTKNCKPAPKQKQQIKNINKQLLSKNHHKSLAESEFPRYVRLYNLNKINSIRNLYRTQSNRAEFDRQNTKEQFRTKTSDSYLQNYVPFYDRLESQVNRSVQKQKFYEKHPQYSCGELKQLFKPTTIPDKYKDKIECRYNRSTKSTKNTNQLQQALNSSLNTSFYSLDKSVQIINRVQQHFFNKMKVIFLNGTQDFVIITQQIIGMLSDVQFKILQNFIMEAQSNFILNENFQAKLKQYYYNLSPNQRLQLRNHQTKKKPKTVQQVTSRDQQSINSFKKKTPIASKYLKKVQAFI